MPDYKTDPIKVPAFNEDNGFYTNPKRSKIMSRIRCKNTKPEISFRKALWALGYRYRVDFRKLPGKPDVVLNKHKVAIFIDGEFWHGHNWEEKRDKIKTNRGFWIPKIERNMQRDAQNNLKLTQLGYKVFRFWEKDVSRNIEGCLDEVISHIGTNSP